MFNCIYANNLEKMGKIAKILGKKRDEKLFNSTSKKVEHEIINNLWDKKSKMFYAKNTGGKLIQTISISNLSPLMLGSIKPNQVEKLLDLLTDKNKFATKFPIPSVPADNKNFDPHYQELRLWRGPTWINTNWMITEALFSQAKRFRKTKPILSKKLKDRAMLISEKTIQLGKKGFWEFYDPNTGEGLRLDNFAWSTLAAVIEKDYQGKSTSKK
jgi:putative isomerase